MAQLLPLALRPDLCLLRLIPVNGTREEKESIRFVQKESLKLLRNQQTGQIQSMWESSFCNWCWPRLSMLDKASTMATICEELPADPVIYLQQHTDSSGGSRVSLKWDKLPEETDIGSDKERLNPAGFLTGLGITHKAFVYVVDFIELMGMHRNRQHRVDFMDWAPGLLSFLRKFDDAITFLTNRSNFVTLAFHCCSIEHHAEALLRLKKLYQDALLKYTTKLLFSADVKTNV
ncbi:hypothetical protein QQ045_004469 [Rhodiola kirilowii]